MQWHRLLWGGGGAEQLVSLTCRLRLGTSCMQGAAEALGRVCCACPCRSQRQVDNGGSAQACLPGVAGQMCGLDQCALTFRDTRLGTTF